MRILVVCVGNVCRSPVTERLLARALARVDRPGEWSPTVAPAVSSAGVRAMVGRPIDDLAAAELVRLGVDPAGHAARQVSQELVEDADLVLTATRAVRSGVLELAPRALRRTFTIQEFALSVPLVLVTPERLAAADLVARVAATRGTVPAERCDVDDPIGRPPEVHRRVAEQLSASAEVIAAALAATRP